MLTLAESAALMLDPQFRGRVKVAAMKYADALLLQSGLSVSRTQWAQRTMQQPDQTAQQLVSGVVINVNVQNAGADVSDPDLTATVQVVADRMM